MSDTLTCPSAPAEPGSTLLGVVTGKGQVAYISPNIPVSRRMLDQFQHAGVPIENRLRFACACLQHRCIQWVGREEAGRCGLIEHAVATQPPRESLPSLPQCGIRPTCRWFAQQGRTACAVCPEIIRRPDNECRAAAEAP
jgi:hypothetical protein